MKLSGVGTRRQALTLAALAALLGLFVVRWATVGAGAPARGVGLATAARAAAADPNEDRAASPARRAKAREIGPDEIPALTAADLSPQKALPGADSGRDLFDFRAPTPTPPPPPPPTPTPLPACGQGPFVGPCPEPPPPTATPTPAPPAIAFKCIGTFGPKDKPIAVLVMGDKIVNARAGDVVFERFQVMRVGHESVDIGFVPGAWHWNETRRLAIAP
jgi:hypothetical protein